MNISNLAKLAYYLESLNFECFTTKSNIAVIIDNKELPFEIYPHSVKTVCKRALFTPSSYPIKLSALGFAVIVGIKPNWAESWESYAQRNFELTEIEYNWIFGSNLGIGPYSTSKRIGWLILNQKGDLKSFDYWYFEKDQVKSLI